MSSFFELESLSVWHYQKSSMPTCHRKAIEKKINTANLIVNLIVILWAKSMPITFELPKGSPSVFTKFPNLFHIPHTSQTILPINVMSSCLSRGNWSEQIMYPCHIICRLASKEASTSPQSLTKLIIPSLWFLTNRRMPMPRGTRGAKGIDRKA